MAAPTETLISIRAVSIDYEMRKPIPGLDVCHSSFSALPVHLVPIVRFFGATPAGQKVCLHLHKAFPYFFVPYGDDLPRDRPSVDAYIHKLAVSIDKAMDLSINHGLSKGPGRTYVFNIIVVRGKPFYGFHATEKLFLKIFIYNPMDIARVVALLRSGGVMGRSFIPHEAHLPFLLQVFIDYNIAGMNFIHLSKATFRWPMPAKRTWRWKLSEDIDITPPHTSDPLAVMSDRRIWLEGSKGCEFTQAPRETRCELEIDASTECILNVLSIISTPLSHNSQQKLVQSLALLWEDERARQKELGTPPRPANDPLAPQAMASQQPREVSTPSELFTNDELRARVRKMIEEEKRQPDQITNNDDLGMMHSTPLSNSNIVELPADQLPSSPPASPLPNVDAEVVLSQSDLDTVDILKEMLVEPGLADEDDDLEVEHAPREVRDARRAEAFQREAFDILEASQADFQQQQNQQQHPDENGGPQLHNPPHIDIAFDDDDEEHLFSIPQMDGSTDEMKKSPGKRKYCNLFTLSTSTRSTSSRLRDGSVTSVPAVNPEKLEKDDNRHGTSHLKDPVDKPANSAKKETPRRVHTFKRATIHELPFESHQKKRLPSPTRAPPAPPPPPPPEMLLAANSAKPATLPSAILEATQKHHLRSSTTISPPTILVPETPVPRYVPLPARPSPPVPIMPAPPTWLLPAIIEYQQQLEIFAFEAEINAGTGVAAVGYETLGADKVNIINPQPTPLQKNPTMNLGDGSPDPDLAYCVPPDYFAQLPLQHETPKTDKRNRDPTAQTVDTLTKAPSSSPPAPAIPSRDSPMNRESPLKTPTLPVRSVKRRLNISSSPQIMAHPRLAPRIEPSPVIAPRPPSALRKINPEQTPRLPIPKRVRFAVAADRDDTAAERTVAPAPAQAQIQPVAPLGTAVEIAPSGAAASTSLSPILSSPRIPPNLPRQVPPAQSASTSGGAPSTANNVPVQAALVPSPSRTSSPKGVPPHTEPPKVTPALVAPAAEASYTDLPPADYSELQSRSGNASGITGGATPPVLTGRKVLRFKAIPPPRAEIAMTASLYEGAYHLPAHMSNPKDLPPKPKLVAGQPVSLSLTVLPFQPAYLLNDEDQPRFAPHVTGMRKLALVVGSSSVQQLMPVKLPPSRASVEAWLREEEKSKVNGVMYDEEPPRPMDASQADPSPVKVSQIERVSPGRLRTNAVAKAVARRPQGPHSNQHLTVMSVELHVQTRGDLVPNPTLDPIFAIVYVIRDDDAQEHDLIAYSDLRGALVLSPQPQSEPEQDKAQKSNPATDANTRPHFLCDRWEVFGDELSMLRAFSKLVSERYDVDIFVGWEVQSGSIGYLLARAQALKYELGVALSRCCLATISSTAVRHQQQSDGWGSTHSSGVSVSGRMVLNLWRIMRSETKLTIYTLENVIFEVLGKRVPHYPYRVMTQWFQHPTTRQLCLGHLIEQAQSNLLMMDKLDIIPRTSELARVFGIDFFSVLSRGSQYRVESMMLRLTKPQNYILFSPSKNQVAQQKAPECIPLVMEPMSRMYSAPVLVLDFQSLYPSIVIGYNYCYSTCLGKIGPGGVPRKFGTTTLKLPPGLLNMLGEDGVVISPNEVMFVKKELREGVLPRMLREILETRVMVKQAMKLAKKSNDPALNRMLNARQLGLKMIANVTYGYTSASFSGRMPCVDIADSIVQTGRQTLENAIELINSTTKWKARVVYGDTDSVFVELPHSSKEEAFRIGNEIAAAVTAQNPRPVKLQFEKVYYPCILVSKKRYVGYKYESPQQTTPSFEAKGVETVRRDSCPAVAAIMEKSLQLLFETKDLSRVKQYLLRQFTKIINQRVSIKDFIFAKEVRLGTYSDRAPPPPAAIVAMKRLSNDPRAEPKYGERVPYVVVSGPPNARLVDLVVSPHQLLTGNGGLRLNATYYITKQIIPSLERLLGLAGADIKSWYNSMPRLRSISVHNKVSAASMFINNNATSNASTLARKRTLDQYYLSARCPLCDGLMKPDAGMCDDCSSSPQDSCFKLMSKVKSIERDYFHLLEICMHCTGMRSGARVQSCDSLDCGVYFERSKLHQSVQNYQQMLASIKW